jgi:hypothetical protein
MSSAPPPPECQLIRTAGAAAALHEWVGHIFGGDRSQAYFFLGALRRWHTTLRVADMPTVRKYSIWSLFGAAETLQRQSYRLMMTASMKLEKFNYWKEAGT